MIKSRNFVNYSNIFILVIIFSALFYNIISGMIFGNNEFCYPLDDSFIHLSISKNIVENGVFGITRYEFVSSSSSPIYTVVLAIFIKIFGNNLFLPLIINYLIAIFLIIFTYNYLEKQKIKPIPLFFSILIAIIVTSLPAIASLGMEHTLHIFISLILYFNFLKFIENDDNSGLILTSIIAAFAVVIRYESLASIGFILLYLIFKKQYKNSIIFASIAISLLILFGLFNISNGGYMMPNTILIKGQKPLILYLKNPIAFLLGKSSPILALIFYLNLASVLILIIKKIKLNSVLEIISIYVLFLTMAHVFAADTGYLYRYEAYLVYLNIINFCLILINYMPDTSKLLNLFNLGLYRISKLNLMIGFALLFISLIFTYNLLFNKKIYEYTTENQTHFKKAAKSIYFQQIQSSKFLKSYYNSATVVANDIGAICYFTDIKLIDLVGLGSNHKLQIESDGKEFDINTIYEETKNDADFAIIYDSWFEGKIPTEWVKVREWFSPFPYGVADTKLSFYSIKKTSMIQLQNNLNKFEIKYLPKEIKIKKYNIPL